LQRITTPSMTALVLTSIEERVSFDPLLGTPRAEQKGRRLAGERFELLAPVVAAGNPANAMTVNLDLEAPIW
jgi:hypothetical protein